MGLQVERLLKLELYNIKFGELFSRMWPLWSAELREVRFVRVFVSRRKFDCLHHPFPKLVKISLYWLDDLNYNDIAEMLKYNPQLKELGIHVLRM